MKDNAKNLKLHSASVYGDTVKKILNETHNVYCRPCKHYEKDKKVCNKTHHCDCDCPDCSPESYASESDFEENPWTENKIDEKLGK